MTEPRIFALSHESREIPFSWQRRRDADDDLDYAAERERAIEVAPGVRVADLGWGSSFVPGDDGPELVQGARIAVWSEETDELAATGPTPTALAARAFLERIDGSAYRRIIENHAVVGGWVGARDADLWDARTTDSVAKAALSAVLDLFRTWAAEVAVSGISTRERAWLTGGLMVLMHGIEKVPENDKSELSEIQRLLDRLCPEEAEILRSRDETAITEGGHCASCDDHSCPDVG